MKQQDLFQYPAIQTGLESNLQAGHSSPRLLLRGGEGEKEVYWRRKGGHKAVGQHVCRLLGNKGPQRRPQREAGRDGSDSGQDMAVTGPWVIKG